MFITTFYPLCAANLGLIFSSLTRHIMRNLNYYWIFPSYLLWALNAINFSTDCITYIPYILIYCAFIIFNILSLQSNFTFFLLFFFDSYYSQVLFSCQICVSLFGISFHFDLYNSKCLKITWNILWCLLKLYVLDYNLFLHMIPLENNVWSTVIGIVFYKCQLGQFGWWCY